MFDVRDMPDNVAVCGIYIIILIGRHITRGLGANLYFPCQIGCSVRSIIEKGKIEDLERSPVNKGVYLRMEIFYESINSQMLCIIPGNHRDRRYSYPFRKPHAQCSH